MDIPQFLHWCATGYAPCILAAIALAAIIFGSAAENAVVGDDHSIYFFVFGPTLIPLGIVLALVLILSLSVYSPA